MNIKKFYLLFIVAASLMLGCKEEQKQNLAVKSDDPEILAINQEIESDPKNASLYFRRAQKFYGMSKYESAIFDLQKALSIDSLNPTYYHLLSDSYLDNYNSDEAIMTLYKVLKIFPNRVPTMLKLSELKYIIEDYDGSILLLNEITKVDNQNAEAYYMLGTNFKQLGDIPRAINSFQTATEMNSKLTDAWIALAEIYEEKKDKKALQYYESAVLSDPKSMIALHGKAFYLQNHNRIPEAKTIYRTIIFNDQAYSDAYLNLGYLYMDEDSIDKAYEQFNTLVGIAPTNYIGFYMRGIVMEKKRKFTEAINDYKSARNLNSTDKRAEDALSRLSKK